MFCKLHRVNFSDWRFVTANRNNVHVVQRDNGWGTLREGGQRATQVFDTQVQAIQAGRQMAQQGQGELLIRGQDGRIRARDSYGNDPCPPKDAKSSGWISRRRIGRRRASAAYRPASPAQASASAGGSQRSRVS
ncbi:DUF2188 domain-containing protein [Rubrivivax benzoatilyticus]|uniref:DUF2188 domain-containing protein n=1 Tax=Rubrivivax benzoatilyticus TaxID=316997 RepID=UPI00020A4526|nr:DUF2188 domain-containing protein [Rubrivivax benzoatilyticus]EGJ12164.1 hypothetical protein RBXJA2T_17621 [Rubrivivax benzoatilyticus JA2 = ATCC BAA-35]